MVKAIMYRILPACVDWCIAVDTDVLFAGDVQELWGERLRFRNREVVGGVPEANRYNPRFGAPNLPNVINAGILLQNVRRLREIDLMGKALLDADCKLRKASNCTHVLKEHVPFADQSMMALVLSSFPEYLHRLPPRWNIQGCARLGPSAGAERKATGGRAAAFHFTCRRRDIDSWPRVRRLRRRLVSMPLKSF
uniref:Hexosyltransferase n=1 Tax=Tetraselmis sp. GSL018 TaxID=582737 RepID=A0A061QHF1_9CHLO